MKIYVLSSYYQDEGGYISLCTPGIFKTLEEAHEAMKQDLIDLMSERDDLWEDGVEQIYYGWVIFANGEEYHYEIFELENVL